MRQLQLKFQVLAGILAIFAFFALIPSQTQAASLSYGDWELDGFFRNNTGFWTENWDYAPNNDPLATCRNWFRLNLNGKISNSLRLKAEVLAIYETEISREHGALEANMDPIRANEYNYFDFRELRLDWRPKMGHNIRIGKQIVNWGESLSARVGDVINPVDYRFDLGFTNLEDTRMPIWMIRGIHQFYNIGTSIDWIFAPYMQADRYRTSRTLAYPATGILAGPTNLVPGGQKFAPYPNLLLKDKYDNHEVPHNQIFMPVPNAPAGFWMPGFILYPPYNTLYEPLTAAQAAAIGGPSAGYYLLGAPLPLDTAYPSSSLKDARYGFKTSSTVMGAQTGVYYFHRHRLAPLVYRYPTLADGITTPFQADYSDEIDIYGLYANKNFDFGVLRFDAAYKPNYPYNTNNFTKYPDLVAEKDNLMVQIGFNKDFMFRPLNPFQTFNLTCEYVGEFILEDDLDDIQLTFVVYNPVHKDSHTFFASLGTNYNFGMYSYDLTVIYNLRNAGLIKPKFTYNPDWMNRKWRFSIEYANVFAADKYDTAYGLLEEKDLVVFTTQFSFP